MYAINFRLFYKKKKIKFQKIKEKVIDYVSFVFRLLKN